MPLISARRAAAAIPLTLLYLAWPGHWLGTRVAAARPSAPATTVVVAGHGLGHGRGMGQYGAFGYASEPAFRWSWRQIVEHYYGSAHIATIAGGDRALIDVDLSELDGAATTVVRAHRPGAQTQDCQVYGGAPSTVGLGGDAVYTQDATSSTAGEVMCTVAATTCPAADVAATEYSSSTGGSSAGGTFPSVVDAGDAVAANPFHDWRTSVRVADVEALYPAIGAVTALHVTSRNGHGADGGRGLSVRITGTGGSGVTVDTSTFAGELGLPSDWFRFVTQP